MTITILFIIAQALTVTPPVEHQKTVEVNDISEYKHRTPQFKVEDSQVNINKEKKTRFVKIDDSLEDINVEKH